MKGRRTSKGRLAKLIPEFIYLRKQLFARDPLQKLISNSINIRSNFHVFFSFLFVFFCFLVYKKSLLKKIRGKTGNQMEKAQPFKLKIHPTGKSNPLWGQQRPAVFAVKIVLRERRTIEICIVCMCVCVCVGMNAAAVRCERWAFGVPFDGFNVNDKRATGLCHLWTTMSDY